MRSHPKRFGVVLLALLAFSCIAPFGLVFAQSDLADSQLQAANSAVNLAFDAVLDAETTGGDVMSLLVDFNSASNLLAQAQNSYRSGDFASAVDQAADAISVAEQVTSQAQVAKQTGFIESQNVFWGAIAVSVIGIVIFVLVLSFVWWLFRKNYDYKFSSLKPEVIHDEA